MILYMIYDGIKCMGKVDCLDDFFGWGNYFCYRMIKKWNNKLKLFI